MVSLIGLLAATLGPVQVSMPPRPDCPAPASVAEDIETLMGAAPPIEVRIEVHDTREGVVAELVYTNAEQTQTRSIPGSNCTEVVGAAAVVVAVGVDAIAVGRTLEPVLQRPSEPEVPVAIEPPPALPLVAKLERTRAPEPERRAEASTVESSRDAKRRRRLSLGAFARGGVSVGGLPSAMGWVGGGLELGVDELRLELSGQHLFAQRIEHAEDASAGADVSLSAARAAACKAPRPPLRSRPAAPRAGSDGERLAPVA